MEACVQKGLARSIGVSNFNSQQLQRVLDVCSIKPVTNQVIDQTALHWRNVNGNLQFQLGRVPPISESKNAHWLLSSERSYYYRLQVNNVHVVDRKYWSEILNCVFENPAIHNNFLFSSFTQIVHLAISPLGSPDRPWAKAGEPILLQDPKIKEMTARYPGKSVAQILIRYQASHLFVSTGLFIIEMVVQSGSTWTDCSAEIGFQVAHDGEPVGGRLPTVGPRYGLSGLVGLRRALPAPPLGQGSPSFSFRHWILNWAACERRMGAALLTLKVDRKRFLVGWGWP